MGMCSHLLKNVEHQPHTHNGAIARFPHHRVVLPGRGGMILMLHPVALRPIETDDIDRLYDWQSDSALEILAGWGPQLARSAFRQRQTQRIAEPRTDLVELGIMVEQNLIGYVQLACIDIPERRAAIGILIGDRAHWGQGIGGTAVRLLVDYAFTVRGLERIYAESYDFNTRAHRMFERVGFQREGILRQHEFHNGTRRDMHHFGILKPEFYQRYETIFRLNEERPTDDGGLAKH